jgi:hypothetical protein
VEGTKTPVEFGLDDRNELRHPEDDGADEEENEDEIEDENEEE